MFDREENSAFVTDGFKRVLADDPGFPHLFKGEECFSPVFNNFPNFPEASFTNDLFVLIMGNV